MDEIPQWAIERRKALIEDFFQENLRAGRGHAAWSECTENAFARYIAEHEKPPVDPLLVEARRVAMGTGNWSPDYAEQMVEGELDDSPVVRAALAALRRGIEIGKGGCQDV